MTTTTTVTLLQDPGTSTGDPGSALLSTNPLETPPEMPRFTEDDSYHSFVSTSQFQIVKIICGILGLTFNVILSMASRKHNNKQIYHLIFSAVAYVYVIMNVQILVGSVFSLFKFEFSHITFAMMAGMFDFFGKFGNMCTLALHLIVSGIGLLLLRRSERGDRTLSQELWCSRLRVAIVLVFTALIVFCALIAMPQMFISSYTQLPLYSFIIYSSHLGLEILMCIVIIFLYLCMFIRIVHPYLWCNNHCTARCQLRKLSGGSECSATAADEPAVSPGPAVSPAAPATPSARNVWGVVRTAMITTSALSVTAVSISIMEILSQLDLSNEMMNDVLVVLWMVAYVVSPVVVMYFVPSVRHDTLSIVSSFLFCRSPVQDRQVIELTPPERVHAPCVMMSVPSERGNLTFSLPMPAACSPPETV